jgi:hypothetical protein
VSGSYFIRPKADRDLDDQAFYLATEAILKWATDFSWQRMKHLVC